MVIRRLNKNSEPQATIEAGNFTLQYVNYPSEPLIFMPPTSALEDSTIPLSDLENSY